jgi:hypothetical protein
VVARSGREQRCAVYRDGMRATAAARSNRVRSASGLTAALATAGLLAGCAGGGGASATGGAPPGAASPAAATAAAPAGPDLARGLLPAEAFGAGATVVPVSLAQLQQQLAAVPGGVTSALAGVQITPPACASALQGLGAGLVGTTGLAGEGARTGHGGTAEALVTGSGVATAAETLRTVAGACSTAQVSSPHGGATVTLTPVTVPALGKDAAAVEATAVLTHGDHPPVTVSGLLAAVQDGDRLVLLGTAAPGGSAPDLASFTSLLQRAYDTESHALG